MLTSPALAQMETSTEAQNIHVVEDFRTLVRLIERVTAGSTVEPGENTSGNILIETEVEGCRYLLVRLPRPASSRIHLSPREQEIVRMVAKGHPNKVIAGVLNISSWTVCTHLRRIFAKLEVGSRAAMVARLVEVGILTSGHRS